MMAEDIENAQCLRVKAPEELSLASSSMSNSTIEEENAEQPGFEGKQEHEERGWRRKQKKNGICGEEGHRLQGTKIVDLQSMHFKAKKS